ncbi:unnamed protein product, partial [Mesorhabditis spiculigera]
MPGPSTRSPIELMQHMVAGTASMHSPPPHMSQGAMMNGGGIAMMPPGHLGSPGIQRPGMYRTPPVMIPPSMSMQVL